MTFLPIRLSTNFITFIPSLTFTELWVVSMEHMQRVWLASRERLPFRTPGSVPQLGLANAPIVETKFLELAMSLLDFSPRIPLGTFSILLSKLWKLRAFKISPSLEFSKFWKQSLAKFWTLSFQKAFNSLTSRKRTVNFRLVGAV